MKLKKNFILVILMFLIFYQWVYPSFSQTQEQCPKEISAAIQQVKDEICPDNRLNLFDIWGVEKDSTIVLQGETTNIVAHDSCVQVVTRVTQLNVIDEIMVLPHPELGSQIYAIIKISTANLRSSPSLKAELINQAIMGEVVRLYKKDGGWYFCQFEDGYLGWMRRWSFQITDSVGIAEWDKKAKIVVNSNFGQVHFKKSIKSRPISDLVRGIVVVSIKKGRKWIEVELPDGRTGFVRSKNVVDYYSVYGKKQPKAEDIATTACEFLGYPYLWGGTSAKGFDCSGFTKTVFGLNGIQLPRDANLQVMMGQAVDIDEDYSQLSAGDLLFFGKNQNCIIHVGIYLGNKEFIHCDGIVNIDSFSPNADNFSAYRVKTLQKVKRVL